jgi:hypothetical protein
MGNEASRGRRAENCERNVKLTEGTQGFVAKKGLTSRRCAQTAATVMPN